MPITSPRSWKCGTQLTTRLSDPVSHRSAIASSYEPDRRDSLPLPWVTKLSRRCIEDTRFDATASLCSVGAFGSQDWTSLATCCSTELAPPMTQFSLD